MLDAPAVNMVIPAKAGIHQPSACCGLNRRSLRGKGLEFFGRMARGQTSPGAIQLSSLNRVEAKLYNRRQTSRLMAMTIAAKDTVAARRRRKFPLSVA